MERLTEWKDDKKLLAKTKFSGDFGSANILIALAEYEDLEEQGLLLRLPCKVGDIVYAIDGKNIQTLEAKYDIALISGKVCIFAENCHYADYISYDMIGKTVFLTQAEAEQKLNEMEVK